MVQTLEQFKKAVQQQKVSKFKKIKNLQDAIVNLRACGEGISPLLKESLDTLQTILPKEHVYNDGNEWEVIK